MHANPLIVLGAPIASWALFGCLFAVGVAPATAGIVAVSWGVLWFGLGIFGRVPAWFARTPQTVQRYASARAQSFFSGAVVATLLFPLPVYALTSLLDGVGLMSPIASIAVFSILGSPVPIALWFIALRPATQHDEEVLPVLGFHKYEPQLSAAVLPPRNSRAVR